jgi:hypothetical protein
MGVAFAQQFFGRLYCFGGLEHQKRRRFATPDRIDLTCRFAAIAKAQRTGRNEKGRSVSAAAFRKLTPSP